MLFKKSNQLLEHSCYDEIIVIILQKRSKVATGKRSKLMFSNAHAQPKKLYNSVMLKKISPCVYASGARETRFFFIVLEVKHS